MVNGALEVQESPDVRTRAPRRHPLVVSLPGPMIARLHNLRERYDAVLLDLDGTLLDAASRITPRTRRAVGALVEASFEVLLCTGRSFAGVVDLHRSLGLDTALVAYNGGWIGRPGEDPWRYALIPDSILGEVVRAEARALFSFRHNGDRKVSVHRGHPLHGRVAAWYSGAVFVESERALPGHDLMRVSCFYDARGSAEEALVSMREDVRSMLRLETWPMSVFPEFADTDLHLLEIQASSCGKAEAFEYLMCERGIRAARTIAVGDHTNDLPMLEAAGLAVGMANAPEDVRAVCDVVIGHHAEEGFAEWVETGAPTPRTP